MALEKKLLALSCQRMRRERTRSVSCRKDQNQRFRFFANITFRQLFEKSKFAIARFHGLPKAFKLTAVKKSVIITEEALPEESGYPYRKGRAFEGGGIDVVRP